MKDFFSGGNARRKNVKMWINYAFLTVWTLLETFGIMSCEYTTEQNIHERYCHFQTITLLIVSLNGWMCNLPLCGTPPLVLLAALQLLSEVNNVEIGGDELDSGAFSSLGKRASTTCWLGLGLLSRSLPVRITLSWLSSCCSGWRLNGFHPAALLS